MSLARPQTPADEAAQQALRTAETRNTSVVQDIAARINRLAGKLNDTRIYGSTGAVRINW